VSVVRPSILLIPLLVLAIAGCVTLPSSYTASVSHEADEPNRPARDAAGQYNCVAEARGGAGTPACPSVETGEQNPKRGIRVLDNFYGTVLPSNPQEDAANPVAYVLSGDAGPTSIASDPIVFNFHRGTNGLLPDFIAPGAGHFLTVLGFWNDLNGDGNARYLTTPDGQLAPANEWVGIEKKAIYSYVTPGSHPPLLTIVRPGESEPDVRYDAGANGLYGNKGGWSAVHVIVFTDGSLLQDYTVITVSDALLAPREDGRFPFTAGPESLVDIDVYAAQAPGSVAMLYGSTLATAVNEIGSPTIGYCPNYCYVDPPRAGDGPAAPVVASAVQAVWATYPREWEEQSGSSSAGRLGDHQADYAGWMDLIGRSKYMTAAAIAAHDGALVGRASDGAQTAAPGYFGLEAWVGAWKDINHDGHVGRASSPDPYEKGTRPLPDDYWNPSGEFFGQVKTTNFKVTLTPDDGEWGVATIFETLFLVPLPTAHGPRCDVVNNWPDNCLTLEQRGPIEVSLSHSETEGRAGFFVLNSPIFFPFGSPGFTACSSVVEVPFVRAGEPVVDPVWDCDRFPAWDRL